MACPRVIVVLHLEIGGDDDSAVTSSAGKLLGRYIRLWVLITKLQYQHSYSHSITFFSSRIFIFHSFQQSLLLLTFIPITATMIFGSLSASLVTLLAAASTVVSAAAVSANPTFTGLGTRYGDADGCTEENCWQKGACSFVDYKLPAGIDGSTCVSEEIWDNGANCGGCIEVKYKTKALKIMVG